MELSRYRGLPEELWSGRSQETPLSRELWSLDNLGMEGNKSTTTEQMQEKHEANHTPILP